MAPVNHSTVPIGFVLVTRGFITQAQLDEALRIQERTLPRPKLASVLIGMGAITQQQADACLEQQLRLDAAPLDEAMRMLREVVGDPKRNAERRHDVAAKMAAGVQAILDKAKR